MTSSSRRWHGAKLKLHPPRKTGERLIESEHPWESATLNWFSVLRDGERYRMWYECYDIDGWPTPDDTSFCYAESIDGVHWTKPKLGLFSYQGSTDNNILFRQIGVDKHRSRVHGSCVFIDPSAPPEARYKCVSQGLFQGIGDRPHYVAGMTSPDGLHWTRYPSRSARSLPTANIPGSGMRHSTSLPSSDAWPVAADAQLAARSATVLIPLPR